jgi:hypothetical protein
MIPIDLEPLTADEQAHEARLQAEIVAAIRAAGGWLSFEAFMQMALYAPGLGYYAAGAHKLGVGGDFVTAPELSPVFGRCIAQQCAQVLESLGGGQVLELGAGSGALAADILLTLADMGQLPDRYEILEISPDLRERQRRHLSTLPHEIRDRVFWLDRPPTEPFRGLVLANEVLDALPVARLRAEAYGLTELGIEFADGQLREVARPASQLAVSWLADTGVELAVGQEIEWCARLKDWVAAVTQSLGVGVVLLVDYGEPRRRLYSPDRSKGTLVAFHRHRIHNNPYINLGLQDLTAWVDFTAVAEAGIQSGLDVAGYTTQACFLLACGFERHLAAWRSQLPVEREPLAARAALRLVLPNDMGERFKCMALTRDYEGPLEGFSIKDFTASL